MPMINVKYDDQRVSQEEITVLGNVLKQIVSKATHIPEVFVYGDSPRIKIAVAPIEVFIEMSAEKIQDKEALFLDIKNRFIEWKNQNGFDHSVTITLIPMQWKFETNL